VWTPNSRRIRCLCARARDDSGLVRDLWKAQKRKVNLTLLIIISGSMGDDNKIKAAREELPASFIDQLDDSDNLSIIAFLTRQRDTLIDNQNVGQSRTQMKQAVAAPPGGTSLRLDCLLGQNHEVDPTRINALVVLTDGRTLTALNIRTRITLITDLSKTAEGRDSGISLYDWLRADADQDIA